MRHIIPISGKDSAATAIVQMAREPELPYEFIFCDVRMELPETYTWINRLEKTLNINIVRVGKSLEDVIAEQNMLPSQMRRFCTKYGKIFPMRDYIGKAEAIQYFGLRADEGERGGFFSPANITARYPLQELDMGIQHVYKVLGNRGILPPDFFWQRLYGTVWDRADSGQQHLIERLLPWDRAHLFAWRSRSNCFCCFYQRRYEWIGLLEHYPDLFEKAKRLELAFGSGDRHTTDFTWVDGLPLSELAGQKQAIFDNRVRQVLRVLQERNQGRLFPEDLDPLAVVSCGLLCGK